MDLENLLGGSSRGVPLFKYWRDLSPFIQEGYSLYSFGRDVQGAAGGRVRPPSQPWEEIPELLQVAAKEMWFLFEFWLWSQVNTVEKAHGMYCVCYWQATGVQSLSYLVDLYFLQVTHCSPGSGAVLSAVFMQKSSCTGGLLVVCSR